MGLLDDLMAAQSAPQWGALYQNADTEAAKRLAEANKAQAAAAMMSGNPMADSGVAAPPSSVFDPNPQAAPAPAPTPSVFATGTGALSGNGPSGPMPGMFGPAPAPFSMAGSPAAPGVGAPTGPLTPPPAAAPAPPPAPPAPDQAGPIAVGNYQMPRVGAADDFGPEDAPATDVSAQSRQPQAAPAPSGAAPFSLGGVASSAGDRLMKGTKGFLGNLQNGPIGAIGGGLGALITGKSTDPGSIASEQANLTARALLAKNVAPDIVAAAVHNPELMKTLIAQNFGPDKFQHVTIKNADGSESPQAFDPSTGKYSGAAPQAPNKFSVDPNLTGKDRLDALRAVDPDYARRIESMVNGDTPLPTGVAALKPNADRMIKDVLAVDGSTSASDFTTRASTRRDYASGVASRVTKSLNTTIEHADRLDKAIDELHNYTYVPGVTNWLHDKYSSNMDPKYQAAKSNFESAKEAFIKELDFTLSGGHSSVSGSAELRDKINRADSPEALHAAIQTDLHLLAARLDSHTTGFAQGTKSQRDPQDFLYTKNRPTFNRLMGSQDTSTGQSVPGVDASSGAAPGPSTPGGTAPLPPGNYVWSPQTGVVGSK